ncbi:MAG TPA: PfkB family carbohydrate kinase, partial [Clostridia bacterium]|nr:PfkB family carbohydrate kinase [Clostridia bacterium]
MTVRQLPILTEARLEVLLSAVGSVRVAVIGDVCLDLYWHADMTRSQLSRETPHFPLPIVEERTSPGGAGNVACNLQALRPKTLTLLGAVGEDWRGQLLAEALEARGVACDRLVRAPGRVTNAYIKPLRKGFSDTVYEDPRLDFENDSPLSEETEKALIRQLADAAASADVLCVSDQMRFGCVTPKVRQALCDLGKAGLKVIVDSRDRIASYQYAVVKPNEIEASRAAFSAETDCSPERLADAAAQLSSRTGRPALVTLGERGCLIAEGGFVQWAPACPAKPPLDICGAGDTFLAALALAYGSGADLAEAALFANLAASVTVRKVGITGTA